MLYGKMKSAVNWLDHLGQVYQHLCLSSLISKMGQSLPHRAVVRTERESVRKYLPSAWYIVSVK